MADSFSKKENFKKKLQKAKEKGVNIYLPLDSTIADKFAPDASTNNSASNEIPSGWMGLDIGPKAADDYAAVIKQSKTILWNGPMGVFEFAAFSSGTKIVAQALTEVKGISVVGGGDSAAAVRALPASRRDPACRGRCRCLFHPDACRHAEGASAHLPDGLGL